MTVDKIIELYGKKISVLCTMRSNRIKRHVGPEIFTAEKKQKPRQFQRKLKIYETPIPGTRMGHFQIIIYHDKKQGCKLSENFGYILGKID